MDAEPARGPVVRNETARKVIVEGDGMEIVLAPFDEAELSAGDLLERFDLRALRRSTHVAVIEPMKAGETEFTPSLALLPLLVFGVPIWAVVGLFIGDSDYWSIGLTVIVLMTAVLLIASRIHKKRRESPQLIRSWFARSRGWATQQLYLAANLAIGVLAPAAVIVFSAQLLDVMDVLRSPRPDTDLHPFVVTLVGRALQLAFIAVVSLLPALLFFLFDREQLATLRERFMRQIVRFDSTVQTRSEIHAKYGRAMEEAYGHERADEGRLLPGRRSPVLVATVIITLGWILTLAHADRTLIGSHTDLLALFQPPPQPVVYAFLGAYVYALGAVLRGYVRKDLRPKSYSHITVRTILVIVLAWVLQLEWHGDVLLALVFVAGLVPETAIVLVKEWLRGAIALPLTDKEPEPLTRLEGIDLYDRTRLLDEGVTSVEGLAHHDVVELMLQTRIHASQLLDWVDQAILYLHAGPAEAADGTSREDTLAVLRAYGIRTATDLVTAFERSAGRTGAGELADVLPRKPGGTEGGPSRIQVIYDVIRDEEWMGSLLRWHSEEAVEPPALTIRARPVSPPTPEALLEPPDPVRA